MDLGLQPTGTKDNVRKLSLPGKVSKSVYTTYEMCLIEMAALKKISFEYTSTVVIDEAGIESKTSISTSIHPQCLAASPRITARRPSSAHVFPENGRDPEYARLSLDFSPSAMCHLIKFPPSSV